MHTYIHTVHTYIHTYVHVYIHTCIPYIHTFIHSFMIFMNHIHSISSVLQELPEVLDLEELNEYRNMFRQQLQAVRYYIVFCHFGYLLLDSYGVEFRWGGYS